jgi:glycosyltransferase involved in cell wall biosynthesis
MKRLVLISEYFPSSEDSITGGVEARCFYLSKLLTKKYDVHVITSLQEGKKEENINGVKVHRVSKHPYTSKGAILSRLKFSKAAYKKAVELKPDIIDGYNFISYLPAFRAAKKVGAKAIASYHEIWIGEWIKNKGLVTGTLGSIWERKVLSCKWDSIVSVSNFTKKRLAKSTKCDITVIPNGIERKRFSGKIKKFRDPTIISIGRLTPHKRTEDIIEAVRIARKNIPNLKCVVIGAGSEMKKLYDLAYEKGLDSAIEFKGFVKKHSDVVKMLKQSHLFVSASVLEGFGIVLIESAAARVPFVATDIEPFKEVTSGKGGVIIAQKNPSAIAAGIVKLLSDRKVYSTKVNECAALAKKYEWKEIAKKIEKVYG